MSPYLNGKRERIFLFMQEGNVVESGSPAELLEKGGIFKEMWERQKNGFI